MRVKDYTIRAAGPDRLPAAAALAAKMWDAEAAALAEEFAELLWGGEAAFFLAEAEGEESGDALVVGMRGKDPEGAGTGCFGGGHG